MGRLSRTKHSLYALFAAIIAAICAFTLCACNKTEESGTRSYALRFVAYRLLEEEDALRCYVSMSASDEGALACERAVMTSSIAPDGVWYNLQTITITVSPASIYSAVQEALLQENFAAKELDYNCLKVALRYVTIYKSIKSDAEHTRSEGNYLHDFELDVGDESYTATLTYRYANSASWYSALIAAGIVALAVGVTICSVVKGKLCRKRTTEK